MDCEAQFTADTFYYRYSRLDSSIFVDDLRRIDLSIKTAQAIQIDGLSEILPAIHTVLFCICANLTGNSIHQ